MRVAVVARTVSFDSGIGGLERIVGTHAQELSSRDMDVTLVTPGRFTFGELPAELAHVDVPWPRWGAAPGRPGFGFAYWLWVRRLRRSGQLNRFDALYLHGACAGVLAGDATSVLGRRAVTNPQGMEEFYAGNAFQWTNRVWTRPMSRRARLAHTLIATDAGLGERVMRNTGCTQAQLAFIPNNVDVDTLHDMARSWTGTTPSAWTVVTIGRIVKNKGYDLLLEALRIVDKAGTLPVGWEWIHFGDGPLSATLEAEAARTPAVPLTVRKGCSDREVQANLSRAGLFVQPSRYDGSSLTTLEAMAHERVCVGSPVGGIPDKIVDGETGFLATEASAGALADAIGRAVRQSGPDIGRAAAEKVRREFNVAVTMDALAEALRRAR